MSWRISSCFDCQLLKDRAPSYYCQHYKRQQSYDFSRTVNDCQFKEPFEEEKSSRDRLLDELYDQCVQFSEVMAGLFTARELVTVCRYQNKNSLWVMLEDLVNRGRLTKGKIDIINRYGNVYKVNVYLPVLPAELRPGILQAYQLAKEKAG